MNTVASVGILFIILGAVMLIGITNAFYVNLGLISATLLGLLVTRPRRGIGHFNAFCC